MPNQFVKIRKDGETGSIIMHRADKKNALSREMINQLQSAFHDLHMSIEIRSVVLTGTGDAFCAGLDLIEMYDTIREEDPFSQWHADTKQVRELFLTMLQFPKPIISAVNGPALGAGAGLVLASDVVVASERATFGFPEPRRGLVASSAAPLLMFRTGGASAANLLLTARILSAESTKEVGVFHEVVPDDVVWARAAQLSEEIAQSAPEAISLTKRMLNETIGESLSTLMSAGAAVSATARTTEAAKEGVSAFVEKRDPKWP